MSSRQRYTPKGVRVEKFTQQQRQQIIQAVLDDETFFGMLHEPVQRWLKSSDPAVVTKALISVSKFESLIDYGVVAYPTAVTEPSKPKRSAHQEQVEQLKKFPGMPEDILDDLQSDSPKVQYRGVVKAKRWLSERKERRLADELAELLKQAKPMAAELRSQMGKLYTPAKQLEFDRFLAQFDHLADKNQVNLWARECSRRLKFIESLEAPRQRAVAIKSEIQDLIAKAQSPDQRGSLEKLLKESRRLADDPATLQVWCNKAEEKIKRIQRKVQSKRRPSIAGLPPLPDQPTRVDWDKQDRFKTGNPNPQGSGQVERGRAVAHAGKSSAQLAARGKK